MFDAIIGFFSAIIAGAVTAGAAALAIWGVRQKVRAVRAKRQIEDYQLSSERWERDARERVEAIRRQAAGKAAIDPKSREDFEK